MSEPLREIIYHLIVSTIGFQVNINLLILEEVIAGELRAFDVLPHLIFNYCSF